MFSKLARTAVAAVTFATGLALTQGVAAAEERTCTGTIGAITVDNLRVPDGKVCTLEGTTVKGTIKVESNAVLKAFSVRVIGNVQSEDHKRVVLRSSTVGGSVQLVQGGKAGITSAVIRQNRVGGDVQLFENLGTQTVAGNVIDGNLQCKENNPAPTGGNNRVGGNKEDQCRSL